MTGRLARVRTWRLRLAYRVRTWLHWTLCSRLGGHRWTPWHRAGYTVHYNRDNVKTFEAHVYSRRCTRCSHCEVRDA